jgi:hypothetical protein
LETVRELVGEAKPAEAPAPLPVPSEPADDPRQAVVRAGVQLLEALAALVGGASSPQTEANGNGASVLSSFLATDAQGRPVLQVPVPSPEVLQRGAAALRTIVEKFTRTEDRT